MEIENLKPTGQVANSKNDRSTVQIQYDSAGNFQIRTFTFTFGRQPFDRRPPNKPNLLLLLSFLFRTWKNPSDFRSKCNFTTCLCFERFPAHETLQTTQGMVTEKRTHARVLTNPWTRERQRIDESGHRQIALSRLSPDRRKRTCMISDSIVPPTTDRYRLIFNTNRTSATLRHWLNRLCAHYFLTLTKILVRLCVCVCSLATPTWLQFIYLFFKLILYSSSNWEMKDINAIRQGKFSLFTI